MRVRPGTRAGILIAVAALALLAATAVIVLSGSTGGGRQPTAAAGVSARAAAIASGSAGISVEVAPSSRPLVIPRSFLGISTEYWTIPVWAAHIDLLRGVFSQITQEGPVVLRIGGDSADQALWSPTRELPEWVFELTPSWLAQVGEIVRQLHVKLILDLNLVTANPAGAALWASTAEQGLPRGSIIGFEIGNEPDIYNPASFRAMTGTSRVPPRMTAARYAAAYRTYDQALDRAVPQIPLLAPALSNPLRNVSWIRALLAGSHHGLTAITAHRYPLSACARRGPTVPTVSRLLSSAATAGMAGTLKPAIQAARRAQLPVRLTEFNSVTCGGTRGVSDTFATALWAPDALFELIHAGVRSAALHVRANAINMAFSLTSRGLTGFPLLYGLITYARTLGSDPRLLPARVSGVTAGSVKVWVVLDGTQLRVLLIDKTRRAARVRLAALPVSGTATVQRLLAPSATATGGVTLNGQTLDSGGRWSGAAGDETVRPAGGVYTVRLPGMSAAIVGAAARPGTG